MNKKINKYDIVLIFSIIIISLFLLYYNSKNVVYSDSNEAFIYSNNEIIGHYILGREYTDEFTVTTEDGYNTIKIENNRIWITDADCPDKYCLHQGKIGSDGEVIVCLPHKLIIKVVGDENNDVDIIAH